MPLTLRETTSALLPPLATLLAGIIVLRVIYWLLKAPSSPLPPGPRGWPIIGNALDFPREDRARGFRDLSAQYGRHLSAS